MNWNDIPEAFVNKGNFIRLAKEAYGYRRWRNIFALLALCGWVAFTFLLLK